MSIPQKQSPQSPENIAADFNRQIHDNLRSLNPPRFSRRKIFKATMLTFTAGSFLAGMSYLLNHAPSKFDFLKNISTELLRNSKREEFSMLCRNIVKDLAEYSPYFRQVDALLEENQDFQFCKLECKEDYDNLPKGIGEAVKHASSRIIVGQTSVWDGNAFTVLNEKKVYFLFDKMEERDRPFLEVFFEAFSNESSHIFDLSEYLRMKDEKVRSQEERLDRLMVLVRSEILSSIVQELYSSSTDDMSISDVFFTPSIPGERIEEKELRKIFLQSVRERVNIDFPDVKKHERRRAEYYQELIGKMYRRLFSASFQEELHQELQQRGITKEASLIDRNS